MFHGFKNVKNYLMIVFILTFALNCADGKHEDSKKTMSNTTLSAAPAEAGTEVQNLDPEARRRDETPEDYQLRIAKENNVKKRITKNYLYDLNGNLTEGAISEEIEFDKQGRRIEHVVYRGTNQINYIWKFKYDDNDNVVEFESYDRNNVLQLKKTMTYNNDNKVKDAKEIYITRGNEITYNYTYNDKGLLIRTEGKNSAGGVSSEEKEYNSDDKVRKIVMVDEASKNTAERMMEYDSKGNLLKETLKLSNQPEQVTTYSNYSGFYPGEIVAPIRKMVYEYDNRGNVTLDIMYNADGGRQHKFINDYDEKGLIVKRTRYDGRDNPALIIKYEYEFYK